MVWVSGFGQVGGFLLLARWGLGGAVLEAEAVVSGLQDMTVMCESIEQRRRHLGIAEDGRPFTEAEVGGDDDAGALVERAQQMEQQRPARRAEGQVSELVQDDEIGMGEPVGDLTSLALSLLLLERVDELDGGEEADTLAMMLDGLHAEGGGDMSLAGARAADKHDVVGILHELASVELAHEGLVDLAAGEVEACQVAIDREAGCLELVGYGPDLPLRHLGLQQLRQDRDGGLEGGRSLLGELGDGLRHAVHLQAPEHDDDGAAGGIMTHDAPPEPGAAHRSARHWPVAPWPGSAPAVHPRRVLRSACRRPAGAGD